MTDIKTRPLGATLANLSENKLTSWRECLREYGKEHPIIYAVSDTETTGVSILDKRDKVFNRIVEWAVCFCYPDEKGILHPCIDKSGSVIAIDEPINPFIHAKKPTAKQKNSIDKVPADSTEVHGITLDYLFGESDGARHRPKLQCSAPTYPTVLESVNALLSEDIFRMCDSLVVMVFHNSDFDVNFLNHESETWNLPLFESYFGVADTLKLAKRIFTKEEVGGSYSLDSLYEYGKRNYPHLIDNVDRPIHSAIIDVMITVQVYNIIRTRALEKNQ
jgi:DNA polymerase III epsilon subunit-like protein